MSPIAPPLSFNPAGIELDRRQGLTRQLYDALRQRVLDGRLVGPCMTLPTQTEDADWMNDLQLTASDLLLARAQPSESQPAPVSGVWADR